MISTVVPNKKKKNIIITVRFCHCKSFTVQLNFKFSNLFNTNSKKEEIKLNYDILNSMNEKEINEL